MEFFKSLLKTLLKKLKNLLFSNRASNVINTSIDGFQNNIGKVFIQAGSGNQTNNYTEVVSPQLDFDPAYRCHFFNGERVCSVCAPAIISELKEGSLGHIPHFRCETCGKVYYKKND